MDEHGRALQRRPLALARLRSSALVPYCVESCLALRLESAGNS